MTEAAVWSLEARDLSVAERPAVLSVLRLHRDDADGPEALAAAFGTPWPRAVGVCAEGGLRVAWLAPGEWALFASAAELRARVAQACSGRLHHLSDLSAGRTLWRVGGPRSRAVIARGCSLDTHPRVMAAGRCVQTLLTQIPILLVAQAAGDAFEIVADASFAGHLRSWFSEAAQEPV